jgi:hypothetical protein
MRATRKPVGRPQEPGRLRDMTTRFRIFTLSAVLLAPALLTFAGCEHRPDVAQFERYAKASKEHDLATLEALTADSIVWQLGPYTFKGKKEALGPNAYDAGVQNQLVYRNASIEGNVVEFELIERNAIIRAVGMTEVRSYPRWEFEDGQLKRKAGRWKEAPAEYSLAELERRKVPLRTWIRATHPEAMQALMDSEGHFVFSRDTGALMLRLAREWVAAGAPGRLGTQ